MIQRVYEQTKKSTSLIKVVVATDHQEIYDHVKSFGGEVAMTREDHPSGTDRCYEAVSQQAEKYDYVINIQGDEPFIKPEQIDLIASRLDGKTEIATLVNATLAPPFATTALALPPPRILSPTTSTPPDIMVKAALPVCACTTGRGWFVPTVDTMRIARKIEKLPL